MLKSCESEPPPPPKAFKYYDNDINMLADITGPD